MGATPGDGAATGRVLVVDDDGAVGHVLCALLRQAGHHATHVKSGADALRSLQRTRFDVVISDLNMPGMTGMELLRIVTREWSDLPVVLLTAFGTVATAVEAMKAGATDFVLKPFERDEVLFTVNKALASHRARGEEPPRRTLEPDGLLGRSPAMLEMSALLERAARSSATVLLRGETGTGKELAARTLHAQSPRCEQPFIAVHCAALPDTLLESELFGYEKGAFTGASGRKPGRVELAEGGTLFLDEIGDLPPIMQVKLLRLLQEKTYDPLGATRSKQANVRFVAATHRDLESMVEAGSFREDLFYRLSVLPIWIPPLREHPSDICLIAEHVCAKVAREHGRGPVHFEAAALELLSAQTWQGNVRELESFVERVVILVDQQVLTAGVVERELGRRGQRASSASSSAPASLDDTRASAERAALEAALTRAGNSRTVAARILGVSRRTLYNKLAEYGLG